LRSPLKRRTSVIILLLIVAGVGGWVILEVFAESQGMNWAFFYFVVTGNGEGKMAGYYGYINNPDQGPGLYSHTYARITESINIFDLKSLANASGYETFLTTNPPEYDPDPPRVAIRNRVTLYPNNVPVNFTIIVLEGGYITIKVNSDCYLRDGWMRNVFIGMLQDVKISPSILSQFELSVNSVTTFEPLIPL
jgi:hypothetical protein